jgi:hypothetical protein
MTPEHKDGGGAGRPNPNDLWNGQKPPAVEIAEAQMRAALADSAPVVAPVQPVPTKRTCYYCNKVMDGACGSDSEAEVCDAGELPAFTFTEAGFADLTRRLVALGREQERDASAGTQVLEATGSRLASFRKAQALAERFHEAYERLAPQFGYTTRPETRTLDLQSNNGRLMVAVCQELLSTSPQSCVAPSAEGVERLDGGQSNG